MGARSRSFPSAEPSHGSISRAVAPGCRAGRTGAAPAPAGAGLGPRSAPLPPGSLHLRAVPRGQLQNAETFPFPAALTLIFWLIRLAMVGLSSRYLFNNLLFGGRGV